MGKEIVYCSGCGKSLREEDFERRRAHQVDHQSYCVACRPLLAEPAKGVSSTRKIPLATAPRTSRRAKAAGPPKGLLIGIAIAVAVLLVILVAVASKPARPAADPVAPVPAPSPAPPSDRKPAPPPGSKKTPESTLRELEAFAASTKDAFSVLVACDEARSVLKGTPHEPALRRIEETARVQESREREASRLNAFLAEIRARLESDPKGELRKEVLQMYATALGMAGSRREEVAGLRTRYEQSVKEPPPPPSPAPPAAVRSGPAALPAGRIYLQDFSGGKGGFDAGEQVDGGVEGTKTLSLRAQGGMAWGTFRTTVKPSTTLRLKLKAVGGVGRIQVLVWAKGQEDNARYFINHLPAGEWKTVEFNAAELRMGPERKGPSLAIGEAFDNLKVFFAGDAEARLLLDDVEVLE